VVFGPDGHLYIGTGDGGSADDPERRALDVTSLLGKMLRIDPLAAGDRPYTVPADNPFVGTDGVRPEIWGVGLRNPWRYTFDPANGDLWVADVGQNRLEEINHSPADAAGKNAGRGMNYGWSAFEGSDRFNDDQPAVGATPPLFQYVHGDLGCSISGGAVYRGTEIPALAGWYVYGDYCSGQVRAIRPDGDTVREVTLAQSSTVVAVKPGPDGELYLASLDDGVFLLAPS
jgi:glucose/arabinose dehydrogenase